MKAKKKPMKRMPKIVQTTYTEPLFSRKTIVTTFILLAVIAAFLAWLSNAKADECKFQKGGHVEVCFCHNLPHNPHTVCTDNEGLINGHMKHVEDGFDSLSACQEEPSPDPIPSPTPVVVPDPSPTPDASPIPDPTEEPLPSPEASPSPEVVPTDPVPTPPVDVPEVHENVPPTNTTPSDSIPCTVTTKPTPPILEGSGTMGCSLVITDDGRVPSSAILMAALLGLITLYYVTSKYE